MLIAVLAVTVVAAAGALEQKALPLPATQPIDFARDIAPIFREHCLECHGPKKQKSDYRLDVRDIAVEGGDSGEAAIIPGKSAESRLIHFVAGLDADMVMPPKKDDRQRLSLHEIALLRAWIDQGATWSGGPAKPPGAWWSLQPLTPVQPPPLPEDAARWTRNPIDSFVRAKLSEKGLAPSPQADRRTLLRRIYFDLIGLPPTPEETAAFISSTDPDAFEKLVVKLLASPLHGERWARHWLDVVRFAETTGFETNVPRPNAWPYRDYVIQAFNDDKPYDRFVMEQIAGDALNADEATGFLVGGPNDNVKSPEPVLTAQQRADELHDIVSTTSSTFLALTVGCARCHNHKFDPIPQRDYYAVKACFEGVRHGERPRVVPDDPRRQQALAGITQQLAATITALDAREPFAQPANSTARRPAVNPRRNVERFSPVLAKRLRFTIEATNNGIEPCLDELEVFAENGANVALASADAKATSSGDYPNDPNHRLAHLHDGRFGNSRSWISNQAGSGWVELEFGAPAQIERVVWARDRERKYTDRVPTKYRVEIQAETGPWTVVASSSDRTPLGGGGSPEGAAPADEGSVALRTTAERLEARRSELTAPAMHYGGIFDAQPAVTPRFHRGDAMQPREPVGPGALAAIPIGLNVESSATDQARRLALARWIANPENPLTARVMVNRIWQWHFGEGLVSTPSDFGLNGSQPSHPELLDWLANDFIAHGWSLKYLHRLIVTSATYQQASRARAEALAVDANARLLWRFPPRRLEAEPIRDSILAVSGKLDLRPAGPGFSVFEPNDNYVRVYNPRQTFGPAEWRRMIYMTKVRMQQDATFGAFDCPDGGQIAPKRSRSITPLQALNLLNSSFVQQQSGFFAARLHQDCGEDVDAQISRAFLLSVQREPSTDERGAAQRLISRHGLAIFCRALFNTNEFVFVP